MSFKSSLSCLILAMTTCLFFPNSLCCDVKDALDVRSQFLIVSRRNRNQALKSSMPNLDFRRQSCFTDNSHDIITLHTIGKVCQSKEIVGNLEDFAPGTVLNSLLHVSEYLHRLIMHSKALEWLPLPYCTWKPRLCCSHGSWREQNAVTQLQEPLQDPRLQSWDSMVTYCSRNWINTFIWVSLVH